MKTHRSADTVRRVIYVTIRYDIVSRSLRVVGFPEPGGGGGGDDGGGDGGDGGGGRRRVKTTRIVPVRRFSTGTRTMLSLYFYTYRKQGGGIIITVYLNL